MGDGGADMEVELEAELNADPTIHMVTLVIRWPSRAFCLLQGTAVQSTTFLARPRAQSEICCLFELPSFVASDAWHGLLSLCCSGF